MLLECCRRLLGRLPRGGSKGERLSVRMSEASTPNPDSKNPASKIFPMGWVLKNYVFKASCFKIIQGVTRKNINK